jgi:hypothetical protein
VTNESRPASRLPHIPRPNHTTTSGARATGLQTALSALAAAVRELEGVLGPQEYLVLLDILGRFVTNEKQRVRWREAA